jgi:hypothetical protein
VLRDEANGADPKEYDAAIVFANVSGFAQESTIRIHWSAPIAADLPWYATEVPTVYVSLSLPSHLIDVPIVKTVIHAYAPSREAIRATVEKIQGKSPFQGTFNENVFCDTFGTRRSWTRKTGQWSWLSENRERVTAASFEPSGQGSKQDTKRPRKLTPPGSSVSRKRGVDRYLILPAAASSRRAGLLRLLSLP